VVQRDPSPQ
jgi:hypothetical protein